MLSATAWLCLRVMVRRMPLPARHDPDSGFGLVPMRTLTALPFPSHLYKVLFGSVSALSGVKSALHLSISSTQPHHYSSSSFRHHRPPPISLYPSSPRQFVYLNCISAASWSTPSSRPRPFPGRTARMSCLGSLVRRDPYDPFTLCLSRLPSRVLHIRHISVHPTTFSIPQKSALPPPSVPTNPLPLAYMLPN